MRSRFPRIRSQTRSPQFTPHFIVLSILDNKVRLGFPRIIQLKENALELDYSSFYGKLVLETRCFVVEVQRSS